MQNFEKKNNCSVQVVSISCKTKCQLTLTRRGFPFENHSKHLSIDIVNEYYLYDDDDKLFRVRVGVMSYA